MNTETITPGGALRTLRAQAHLTLAEAAELGNTDISYLSRVETGRQEATPTFLGLMLLGLGRALLTEGGDETHLAEARSRTFLNPGQVEERFPQLNRGKLSRLRFNDRGPRFVKRGPRTVLYLESEIRRWLASPEAAVEGIENPDPRTLHPSNHRRSSVEVVRTSPTDFPPRPASEPMLSRSGAREK
ncbi:transcriptional regulator with XRE-family HTH domain [Mycetocola sp. BIGb0189]|uniref:helix-turn-helix domain-containing protein n=1 Tax=Mycetocola sp. BIGb0189 TaxID=2940604 RepID=UPI00216A1242|nr:helix-turn-helix transcriptional regulator [Mycetocola sp. BIGb0189]MCS4276756.1 transcriptional regulator with XRE-family HTH domain [Mycetocola sp. BIGb0189]